jgi:uncharacterized protein DUF1837
MKEATWVQWLADTGERLRTIDGKLVEVWEFHHENNQEVLSAWARHFRNQYCLDSEIDCLRGRKSRKDYLNDLKFPSTKTRLGPATRAGDFGEILVADYLEWVLGHWVPRMRWCSKAVRDESTKGCDVIGFRVDPGHITLDDALAVFEAKTSFSRSSSGANRLQDAVNGSAKDHIRIDESLNYLKQKLLDRGNVDGAQKIERFQNPVDTPYRESYGAVALLSTDFFDKTVISETDVTRIPRSSRGTETYRHPYRDRLVLLVIHGADMMRLVHELYRKAADEA